MWAGAGPGGVRVAVSTRTTARQLGADMGWDEPGPLAHQKHGLRTMEITKRHLDKLERASGQVTKIIRPTSFQPCLGWPATRLLHDSNTRK